VHTSNAGKMLGFVMLMIYLAGFTHHAFSNQITTENAKPGTAHWQITDFGSGSSTRDPEIAGFSTESSIAAGAALPVKVHRAGGEPGSFAVDVYRLGYYQGIGARQMGPETRHTVGAQSPCVEADKATRLVECSAWPVGFTVQTHPDWTSGFYLAKLTDQSGKQSYVLFVVRNDDVASDIVLQINFNCAQAYNNYGGYSLYENNSLDGARAFQVSYDRPYMQVTFSPNEDNNPLRFEFAMLYWLEAKGYSVTYMANTDFQDKFVIGMALSGSLHKLFLVAGHDEYWSLEERLALQTARDRPKPLNLAFFSANTGYWRVRLDPSLSSHQPNRTVTCYKDQWIDDPMARNTPANATNQFRGLQNRLPENGLLGVMYNGDFSKMGLGGGNTYRVQTGSANDPYFTGAGLVRPSGMSEDSALQRLVGFEWDSIVNNGAAPELKALLVSSFGNLEDVGQDLGNHPMFTDRSPDTTIENRDAPHEAGVVFESDTAGLISSIRYWRARGDWGTHFGRIWTAEDSPTVVGLTKFSNESPEGWQRSPLIPPVSIAPHQKYIVTVNGNGPIAQLSGGLRTPQTMGHLTALPNGGMMGELAGYPGWRTPTTDNYLRDIDFIPYEGKGGPTVNVYSANAVRFTLPNGAKVVSIGSINWAWGLATPPAGVPFQDPKPRIDDRVAAFTENVLADLGARPTN
jgi:hypothetical protein